MVDKSPAVRFPEWVLCGLSVRLSADTGGAEKKMLIFAQLKFSIEKYDPRKLIAVRPLPCVEQFPLVGRSVILSRAYIFRSSRVAATN